MRVQFEQTKVLGERLLGPAVFCGGSVAPRDCPTKFRLATPLKSTFQLSSPRLSFTSRLAWILVPQLAARILAIISIPSLASLVGIRYEYVSLSPLVGCVLVELLTDKNLQWLRSKLTSMVCAINSYYFSGRTQENPGLTSYTEVLEVHRGASADEIRKAYRKVRWASLPLFRLEN